MFVCYFREPPKYFNRTTHNILIRDPFVHAFDNVWMIPPAPGVWEN